MIARERRVCNVLCFSAQVVFYVICCQVCFVVNRTISRLNIHVLYVGFSPLTDI